MINNYLFEDQSAKKEKKNKKDKNKKTITELIAGNDN